MAFFDKLKDAAASAVSKAQGAVDAARAAQEQKKAEQEAYAAEMNEKATQKAQEIIDAVQRCTAPQGFFSQVGTEALLNFTKDFYDKVLMPANSVSRSKITMHPYIAGKKFTKFCEQNGFFDAAETPLIHLIAEKNKEIVITAESIYFIMPLEEDPKYLAKGKVSCANVGMFSVVPEEGAYLLKCDDCVLATLPVDKTTTEDCITLNNYFTCIANKDFTITDEEVDKLIRERLARRSMGK